MDQNTEKAFDEIKKALRPEVTKEQLGMVIEHLMEAIEGMIEMPEEEDKEESDSTEVEVEDMNDSNPLPIGDPNKNPINWPISKSYNNCGCETCKNMNVSCDQCPECSKEMSKSYESDNQDEDKWDNIEKACWTGYKQVGMKEKGGRMVPNCVPVDSVKKSLWDGKFNPSEIKK